MRVKTWRIIDYGTVPEDAPQVPFTCPCGVEAAMPVQGRPLAQVGAGIVFDTVGPWAIPAVVQCRKCRRILTTAPA